jgi:hypothetical protein
MKDSGTECCHSVGSSIFFWIGIILIVGSVFYVGKIQVQQWREVEAYCNEQFGEGNWTLNETTGTGDNKYYIGQVHECIQNHSIDLT